MSSLNFTPAQTDAINARGGSIIVSAAAGSGKTRVLVQRVISMLTDRERPVDADKLLIVTFTKAAADEMKSRISSALEQLLIQEPDNNALRRQQLLLVNADICTIHSFCSRIIRDNFYMLDINQDFRIASEGEAAILKNRIMGDIIEEQYASGDKTFLLLSELLSGSKSDEKMIQTLLSVFISASSHPFPDLWLDIAASGYDPSVPLHDSIFGQIVCSEAEEILNKISELLDEAGDIIECNPDFRTGKTSCGESKLNYLRGFEASVKPFVFEKNWDKASSILRTFSKYLYRRPTGKSVTVSENDCLRLRSCFDQIDQMILTRLQPFFAVTEEEFLDSNRKLYPAVICLCRIVKDFSEKYFEAKKERGVLDFSDLEQLMIRLLVERTENGMIKTALAHSLSEQYDEIMVDEYQDTNDSQECIFRFISKDEKNLFVVGDIKQSIYRFREAVPDIFKRRRLASKPYLREAPDFPAKIILDKNFRSRRGIIDSINFVFRSIMSEQVGEITYNSDEELSFGAEYPPSVEPETELHLLCNSFSENEGVVSENDEEESTLAEKEALYLVKTIRSMLREKKTVYENGRERPAEFGDFAVLMRYLSTKGQLYADILNRSGIPAYIDKPYSLFSCHEVNTALSVLKIIDNPLQDIPMLAVLLSPVAGFTPDDLSILKTSCKGSYYYNRLLYMEQMPEEYPSLKRKSENFLSLYRELRRLAVTHSTSRVLDRFLTKTSFRALISAMENGDIRVRNIKKLISIVNDYEASGKRSVTDFVRYINYLEESKTDISVGDTAPANSVRIMSIHHSKGLEFPFCFLAGLSARGDNSDGDIICHNELGLGIKSVDTENSLKFNTLQSNIIRMSKKREEQSEAMRVLYVALTRAREKLIPIISFSEKTEKAFYKKLQTIASSIEVNDGAISPYSVEGKSSFRDWLLMCALVHPDMEELRSEAGADELPVIPTASHWRYIKAEFIESEEEEASSEEILSADHALLSSLNKQLSTAYANEKRTTIPSKVSASGLVHSDSAFYHVADSRPAFMQEKKLTGAEKGTAMHRFLQYADFRSLSDDPTGEVRRLREAGTLSEQEAGVISEESLKAFIGSSIFKQILAAGSVYREYRFTVDISAADIDDSYPPEEMVILQGAIDLLIIEDDGITIVDYKTDHVSDTERLISRYSRQLLLYRKSAMQIFSLPVKRCLIYSTALGQEAEVTIPS